MKGSHLSASAAALLLLMLVVASSLVQSPESVTCSPYELIPCSGAILGSGNPSGDCCAKLREQQPCFCQYMNDPSLGSYVNSPNARQAVSMCRVPFPKC